MDNDASPGPIRCAIGIMAYNEERNIGQLLQAVLSNPTRVANLVEVTVVASGCTDGTEDIVRKWQARDGRVRLVSQPRREGKASAVNLFLSLTAEKVLLVCSADLIPAPDTIDRVVSPFVDSDVAMTTCRPVPVNDPKRFMGFAAHMLWNLHHELNRFSFKAGELIAFRRVFEKIPRWTAVDEASVEAVVRSQGYAVRYVSDAITWNRGPDTVRDFLRQRRRIYAGHLALHAVGYKVATLGNLRVLGLVLRNMSWRPRDFLWTWAVAALEAYGRLLGKIDYRRARDHSVWEIAETTKQLRATADDRAGA